MNLTALKHSQYFLRQADLRHLHPSLCTASCPSGRNLVWNALGFLFVCVCLFGGHVSLGLRLWDEPHRHVNQTKAIRKRSPTHRSVMARMASCRIGWCSGVLRHCVQLHVGRQCACEAKHWQ